MLEIENLQRHEEEPRHVLAERRGEHVVMLERARLIGGEVLPRAVLARETGSGFFGLRLAVAAVPFGEVGLALEDP